MGFAGWRPPLVDYHVHSTCSADAQSPMDEVCRAAIARGLTEIAFAEHLDMQPDDPGYGFHDYQRYRRALDECRARFGDRLTIRCAIEVSWQVEFRDEIERYLAPLSFDFVIGSVHSAQKEFMWFEDFYRRHPPDECYRLYFEELVRAARSGWFDVLGHLDVPKRYHRNVYPSPFRYADHRDAVDAVLQAAVESGTGIEINTSGLRQGLGETLPALEVVRRYRELGGEIVTVGSDAHAASHVGSHIEDAYELARAAGFKAVATFPRRRSPTFVDL